MKLAVCLVGAGVAVVVAGVAMMNVPVALVLTGAALIGGGLLGVDIEPKPKQWGRGR